MVEQFSGDNFCTDRISGPLLFQMAGHFFQAAVDRAREGLREGVGGRRREDPRFCCLSDL